MLVACNMPYITAKKVDTGYYTWLKNYIGIRISSRPVHLNLAFILYTTCVCVCVGCVSEALRHSWATFAEKCLRWRYSNSITGFYKVNLIADESRVFVAYEKCAQQTVHDVAWWRWWQQQR